MSEEKNPLKIFAELLHQTDENEFQHINVGICADGFMTHEISEGDEINPLNPQVAQARCNADPIGGDVFPKIGNIVIREQKPKDELSPYLNSISGTCASGAVIKNGQGFRDFDFEWPEEEAMDYAYAIGQDLSGENACGFTSPKTPAPPPQAGGGFKKP